MSSPVVLFFTLGDIGNACGDCAARLLKEKIAQLLSDACRERKEKGVSIISLTDMVTGAVLQSCGWDRLDDEELSKIAREFISHQRITMFPFRPMLLTIHTFYRP